MTTFRLRADLIEIDDGGDPRRAKIIDAVSGRVARVARRDLKVLRDLGQSESAPSTAKASPSVTSAADASLLNEAAAMGLLRTRTAARRDGWSWLQSWGPMRWLCIRIPLFSIDRVAARLAPLAGVLFHPLAILFWSVAILLAAASALGGWDRAVQSAGQLRLWGEASASGWMTITAIFAVTKILHELAHAVACRRAGVPCGELGVLLFAGVPCPYCDVSLLSRLDSATRRAGVMLAGIYVELILAALATMLWWIASPGPVQALAMNVMIVCGISTLLFNANPLMRLDGYYVAADLVGAVNLRQRASSAWRALVISRLSGWQRGQSPLSLGELAYATYHLASVLYRAVVLVAVGSVVLSVFDSLGLRPIAMLLIASVIVPLLAGLLFGLAAVVRGRGPWQQTSLRRRGLLLGGGLMLLLAIVFTPLRREIVVDGVIDVAGAIAVHAGQSGWVDEIKCDYGSAVAAGELLLEMDDPRLRFDRVAWDSRKRLASLHSAALRRSALRENSPEMAWSLDTANQELVRSQWQSLKDRQERLLIRSPADGVVLPPTPRRQGSLATSVGGPAELGASLLSRQGSFVAAQDCLCRVGDPNNLCVTLFIDSRHRPQVHQGQAVRVIGDFGSPWAAQTAVDSISEIQRLAAGAGSGGAGSAEQAIWNQDQRQFDVRCNLPPAALAGWSVQVPVGAEVQARIRVADESIAQWLARCWREASGG